MKTALKFAETLKRQFKLEILIIYATLLNGAKKSYGKHRDFSYMRKDSYK